MKTCQKYSEIKGTMVNDPSYKTGQPYFKQKFYTHNKIVSQTVIQTTITVNR